MWVARGGPRQLPLAVKRPDRLHTRASFRLDLGPREASIPEPFRLKMQDR